MKPVQITLVAFLMLLPALATQRTWYGSYGTFLHWPSLRAELPV
jgi:hypothetical protein